MNVSHKSRFLKSKFARVHADLVVQDHFLYAIDCALLEYVNQQVPNKEQYLDACACNRIAGARQFIDVLLNLAEPKQPTRLNPKTNLQHTL